jgi:hypothetical protein
MKKSAPAVSLKEVCRFVAINEDYRHSSALRKDVVLRQDLPVEAI